MSSESEGESIWKEGEVVSKLSYAAVKGGGGLQLGEATSASKPGRPSHWAGRGRHGKTNYYSAKGIVGQHGH